MTTYDVYRKDVLIASDLTEDEYFDLMEDFAQEFYKTGHPKSDELRTEFKEA